MSLQEKIMEYMQTKAKRPMSPEDLLYALALEADEIKQLPSVMEELERKNLLIQNRSGLFGLPKHMNLVIGKMSITAKGFGFVIPDNGLEEGKAKVDDIFIPAGMLNSAMNNDKVLVRITTERSSFTKREGEVIRTFESSRTFGFVVPDDSRLNQDIFIEGRNFNGAKVGMKVVAEITKWPTKNHSPEGKIIEVLGKIGAPGVDILSVMRQYDLSEQFPVDVQEEAKSKKTSTELAGRNARYDFFEEVLKKTGSNKIATAHNLNDNAETVLMNLLRGSGVSGLKGIEKIRDGKFIRPIIECKRSEIEQYCVDNKLNPRYDKTNNENTYTRNKIRNMLIPYIEENFNPNIVDSLNRLSTIATKEDEYIHKIVENSFKDIVITADISKKEIILDLKKFNELDEVIKSRLILYTISEILGTSQGIEKIHIEDIIKLCGNNIGNKYLMPNKNIKIFIKKGKIFFTAVI